MLTSTISVNTYHHYTPYNFHYLHASVTCLDLSLWVTVLYLSVWCSFTCHQKKVTIIAMVIMCVYVLSLNMDLNISIDIIVKLHIQRNTRNINKTDKTEKCVLQKCMIYGIEKIANKVCCLCHLKLCKLTHKKGALLDMSITHFMSTCISRSHMFVQHTCYASSLRNLRSKECGRGISQWKQHFSTHGTEY